MIKIRKNIVFISALFLVLLTCVGTRNILSEKGLIISESVEMQMSDGSSGFWNINEDSCEDEPLTPLIFCYSVAESVEFFAVNLNVGLIFQSYLIPWEPPRI